MSPVKQWRETADLPRIASNPVEKIMALYESDHTKFMREFLEKHPEEVQEQKEGRALWWDKPQDQTTRKRQDAAKVPVKPYYYG